MQEPREPRAKKDLRVLPGQLDQLEQLGLKVRLARKDQMVIKVQLDLLDLQETLELLAALDLQEDQVRLVQRVPQVLQDQVVRLDHQVRKETPAQPETKDLRDPLDNPERKV